MVSINISLHFVRIQETITYFLKRNINSSNDGASFISKASKDYHFLVSLLLYCQSHQQLDHKCKQENQPWPVVNLNS